jgi:hypothetical protein
MGALITADFCASSTHTAARAGALALTDNGRVSDVPHMHYTVIFLTDTVILS